MHISGVAEKRDSVKNTVIGGTSTALDAVRSHAGATGETLSGAAASALDSAGKATRRARRQADRAARKAADARQKAAKASKKARKQAAKAARSAKKAGMQGRKHAHELSVAAQQKIGRKPPKRSRRRIFIVGGGVLLAGGVAAAVLARKSQTHADDVYPVAPAGDVDSAESTLSAEERADLDEQADS